MDNNLANLSELDILSKLRATLECIEIKGRNNMDMMLGVHMGLDVLEAKIRQNTTPSTERKETEA